LATSAIPREGGTAVGMEDPRAECTTELAIGRGVLREDGEREARLRRRGKAQLQCARQRNDVDGRWRREAREPRRIDSDGSESRRIGEPLT
jgi:hypothetical protein